VGKASDDLSWLYEGAIARHAEAATVLEASGKPELAARARDRALAVRARAEAARLRREGNGSRSAERAGELGEDRQVGVKPDPLDAPDSER
jgi:hypothetical protein